MRECEGYRNQIERISDIYPGRASLSISEVSKVLGVDRRTVLALIEKEKLAAVDVSHGSKNKRYIIAVTSIAKMLTRKGINDAD